MGRDAENVDIKFIDHTKGIRRLIDSFKELSNTNNLNWRQITRFYYKDYGENQYLYFDLPSKERIVIDYNEQLNCFSMSVTKFLKSGVHHRRQYVILGDAVLVIYKKISNIANLTKVVYEINSDDFSNFSAVKNNVELSISNGYINVVDQNTGNSDKYTITELAATWRYHLVFSDKYIEIIVAA